MKFPTKYNEHKRVYIEPGSGIKEEFQIRVTENGRELVKTGESKFYEYIQSHADSVDIHKILERCALMDDYSILNRMPATFMDVEDMPKNLIEAYAAIQDANNFFDRMPTDIKEKYNNSFVEFLQDIGSEKFVSNVSDFLDSIKPKTDEKVEVTE